MRAYPELARALQDGQFVVGPMTESDLRRAVTGPAEAARLEIETGLVDSILRDLHSADANNAGVLPLLSQAMLLTWENREGNRLTSHGYGAAGGVSNAVSASADAVYGALPPHQQALARDMLRRMTIVGRDGRLSRRPVTRTDLYQPAPADQRDQIDAVLEAFAGKRLLTLNDGTAEISHDFLLHAWPLLGGWLADDQASLILYSQFAEDAAAWRGSRDDPSFLYRGTQLAAFSPDGTFLATASWDGTARLWDVATQRQIGPPMSIGLNLMNGVAFSPDGKILATAGADGAARLWDIAFPRDLPRAVCAIAGRSLTRAEWNNYAPAESFQRACP